MAQWFDHKGYLKDIRLATSVRVGHCGPVV